MGLHTDLIDVTMTLFIRDILVLSSDEMLRGDDDKGVLAGGG